MRAVYKYALPIDDFIRVPLPKGARVLTVQMQGDTPCMWVLVDPSAPEEMRRFRLAGTGHELPADGLEYVGTFQMRGGALVFHPFEMTP